MSEAAGPHHDRPELDAVMAWHEALNAGDAERVASLSHPEVEIGGHGARRAAGRF